MIQLTGKEVRSLVAAASKDKSHPNLGYIYVTPDRLEATDGFVMLRLNRPGNDGTGSIPVSQASKVKLNESILIDGDTWTHLGKDGEFLASHKMVEVKKPYRDTVYAQHVRDAEISSTKTIGLRAGVLKSLAEWAYHLDETLEVTIGASDMGLVIKIGEEYHGLAMPTRVL